MVFTKSSRVTTAWKQDSTTMASRNQNPHSGDPPLSDSDSATEEEDVKGDYRDQELAIFGKYIDTGEKSVSNVDLSKVRNLLAASRSGAISCLICLEKVRSLDPVWDCKAGCHSIFHLICIQEWARQASNSATERSVARLSRDQFPLAASTALENASWHCPKCRMDYPQSQIPRKYKCFCGKLEDPPNDPWLTPHTCGEICGLPLKGDCGHYCVLLCHPGPCPPCPKLVESTCFCGRVSDVRRCGFKEFSCKGACSKTLECKLHRCPENCHSGPCPPCQKVGIIKCLCKKVEKEGPCCEAGFLCENPCEKLLSCKRHRCSRGCHAGPCGDCPLQGRRTCPCGKVEYKGLSCDASVPTCGSTCEKVLSCSRHRCPERCHRGPCVETCLLVTNKVCRCGSLKKQVPCYQDLVCERKCQRVRDCGRHACKRRCCDGNCPPCSEVCGRKLRCSNHKCPAPCHRGVCAPCPVTVRISCACEETSYEVPCGAERGLKPPKCQKICMVASLCKHGSQCKPHRCHYGPCPPCQLICEEDLPCGHKCKERCHGPRPPPVPEFTLNLKKRKNIQVNMGTPALPCPPCKELVERQCVGKHMGGECMMICSQSAPFRCGNYCSNLLECGNHFCKKPCHQIAEAASGKSITRDNALEEPCDECTLPCQKERSIPCPHPCPRMCHPGDCPPCSVLIKRACHCGAMVHVFECHQFNKLSDEEQKRVRSCGGPCHRKLPSCTHLCPQICHPGSCPSPEMCRKKVTVRCSCQRLKKEWLCVDVQVAYQKTNRTIKDIPKGMFGVGLLPCDNECTRLLEAKTAALDLHQRKQMHAEDKEETISHVPKKRKRREKLQTSDQHSRLKNMCSRCGKCILLVLSLLLIIVTMYLGYRGLFLLSDWMDELDERRAMARKHNAFI